MTRGFVFPRDNGLITFETEGRVTVTSTAAGWTSSLSGEVGAEIRKLLLRDEHPPRLVALAGVHPVAKAVLDWSKSPKRELSAGSALAMDGFGTLFLELLGQCNEHCAHCYAGSGPAITAALPKTMCKEVLTDAAALGFSRVQFTGGDPLLCRFLPELLAHARTLAIPTLEIYTNGLALTDRLLGELAAHKPAFAFSFYSHDPQTHDLITRTPGSHNRTTQGIRRAVDRGLTVRAAIVAMEPNASQIPDTLTYLRDLGVNNVAISPSFEVGRGTKYNGEWPDYALDHGGSRQAGGPVQGKLCVTYEGKVVPCIFNRDVVLGDLRERGLGDIASSPARPKKTLATRSDFIDHCQSSLQCVSCRLTACALQFAPSVPPSTSPSAPPSMPPAS